MTSISKKLSERYLELRLLNGRRGGWQQLAETLLRKVENAPLLELLKDDFDEPVDEHFVIQEIATSLYRSNGSWVEDRKEADRYDYVSKVVYHLQEGWRWQPSNHER